MKDRAITAFVVLSMVGLAGCSMAWPASQTMGPANVVGRRPPVPVSAVQIYREGEKHDRAVVPIAKIAAHGNGYATRATLEQTLIKEAARLGANVVVVAGQEVTKDETIGTYGGGIMVANQIQRPHLYGFACVWQKVRLGVNLNTTDKKTIDYVVQGSPAQKAGVREGDQLLAIDGKFVAGDDIEFLRVLYGYNPGDSAKLELLDKRGEKRAVEVTFASWD